MSNKDGNNDYKKLAFAVVIQAIADWRYLCNGGDEARDCNFKELERFFKNDCDTYLIGTDLSAEKLLTMLQQERRKAGLAEKPESKREQAQPKPSELVLLKNGTNWRKQAQKQRQPRKKGFII